MALRLYAATTSAGKLRDFRTAAQAYSVGIEPLPNIENILAPDEDGDTFLANAATKAVYYSRFAPGELVVADDSGLEVDALGGAPGIRSARFAADSGLVDSPDANDNTDIWNNMLLLQGGSPKFPTRCAPPATIAALSPRAMARWFRSPTAQSKAPSSMRRVEREGSVTIRSSICRHSAGPWPRSILIRSSRSAIAAVRSPRCCRSWPCILQDSQSKA